MGEMVDAPETGEHVVSATASSMMVEGVPMQALLPPKLAILWGEARVRPGSTSQLAARNSDEGNSQ